MKQKTIKTDKATVLVVEFPEEAINVYIHQEFIQYESFGLHKFILPEGNWQLIGRLPDITEEQAGKVVDEYTYNTGEIDGYFSYENDGQTDCPIESLESLLYVNKVYNTFDINRIHLFIKVD